MGDALLQLAGRLHPMVLHLPIGVLAALVVVESWGVARRRPLERSMRIPIVWLLAVTAVMTVASGIVLSDEPGYVGDTVDLHRWLGIVTAAMLAIAAVLATTGRVRAYAGTLVVAAALIVPTGHFGASMTHGDDFLTAPFATPPPQRPGGEGDGTAAEGVGGPDTEAPRPPWYDTRIAPILAAHCTACHGESKRKAGLALHTGAAIHAGSAEGSVLVADDGPGLLVRRIRLPLTDDDHMPPEGKPQLSAEQIDALAAWVEAGAPIDATPAPARTTAPAASPGAGAGAAADRAPSPTSDAAPGPARGPAPGPAPGDITALRAAHVHVERIDPAADLLWIDFTAAPDLPLEKMVTLLTPLAPHTAELSLRGVAAANDVLARCAPWAHLERLDLSNTSVAADGLAAAVAAGHLVELTLIETTVAADAAITLPDIDALERVHLWRSDVPDDIIARLRAGRTALVINDGAVEPPPPLEVEPEVKLGAPPVEAALVPVNTACPVSGAPVVPKFSIVHDGRVIAFCCEVCAGKFWADPAAYPLAAADRP